MDRWMFFFIYLVYVLDVFENVFVLLLDDDYEVVMKRVRELFDFEFDVESMKEGVNEFMWVVIVVFSK